MLNPIVAALGGLLSIVWLYRPIHIVRVQGFWNTVVWTTRSWLWNHPVTPDFDIWNEGDPNDEVNFTKQRYRVLRIWRFLHPFFALKGYFCYIHKDPEEFCSDLIPDTKRADPKLTHFPFARSCCKDDEEARFSFCSGNVWPARDRNGQDVVIKYEFFEFPNKSVLKLYRAVSGASPTRELQAFHLLHSDTLRNDPRNRTIPILEYIEFNKQVFAVMPRWGCACDGDFVNVGELVRYGNAFFEAVAFLHEHKIGHGDILLQNMMMDMIVPHYPHPILAGLRGPERRYALIDFETATLPPVDGSENSPMLEKAFKKDIFNLADELEVHLRCIEDVIPDIVKLFDSMKDPDSQITAAGALARFEEICSTLGAEDLQRHVEATRWRSSLGGMQYRNGPPVYPSSL
ncbi:hypothetical protein FPV67DRAFT_1484801 [Lyophyllum atratum]|nr:hypothetical protein FPV67DRAFT_1484801 [Lyophyllum atratum]